MIRILSGVVSAVAGFFVGNALKMSFLGLACQQSILQCNQAEWVLYFAPWIGTALGIIVGLVLVLVISK